MSRFRTVLGFAMVLVTADFRRRGIATKLVDACLNVAARRGLTTWLDATPAGATVYGPLGFCPTVQLRRLRLTKPQDTGAVRPLSAGNLDALAARDGSAMKRAMNASARIQIVP